MRDSNSMLPSKTSIIDIRDGSIATHPFFIQL
jgi:hypothetical protein